MGAPELRRRRLGRTNLMVTEVGLGAMDTPTSPEGAATLAAAEDAGINFVDTAREYSGSEFLIGQHIRERQSGASGDTSFLLSSKTFSRNINGSQRDIDRSVATLGVELIPLYQLHDISTAGRLAGGARRGQRRTDRSEDRPVPRPDRSHRRLLAQQRAPGDAHHLW